MGFGKDGKGVIIREDAGMTISTLASKTGLLVDAGGVVLGEDYRDLKVEGIAHHNNRAASDPMLSLYMVNGELTLAECEEAIEQNGPTDRNDRLLQEHAERFVKYVGTFVPTGDGLEAPIHGTGVMDFKPRWTFSNPEGWDWMVYNSGDDAMTTGGTIKLKLTHYGVWVT